jgi:hypothetical protein
MGDSKTKDVLESVGAELKANEPAVVTSTRRKFGPVRAEKQREAIMFSKSRKLGQGAKITSNQKKLY